MPENDPQEIRCHGCSHALGRIAMPAQLVALFKPSECGRVTTNHGNAIRRRCDSCGWVNVFHPERSTDVIEVKSEQTPA